MLVAACGIFGTVALIGSFMINPAPPAGLSIGQLADWGMQHHTTIVLGGWLQGVGSLLTVLFSLALGVILQALELVGLFGVLQPVIDVLLIVQGIWFLAAAVALLVRPIPAPALASAFSPAA